MSSVSATRDCGCVNRGVHLHVAVAVKVHDHDDDQVNDHVRSRRCYRNRDTMILSRSAVKRGS
jgi:hypothetical protein